MSRSKFFLSVIFLLFVFLGGRLFFLQIIQGKYYSTIAEENAARINPILASRGLIFDRNGKILVKNRAVFSVYVVPHFLPRGKKDEVFNLLAGILSISREELERRYLEKKTPLFEGITVASDVPSSVVSKIEELRSKIPGVEVICLPMRDYPNPGVASHVLGYIAEIGPDELGDLAARGYRLGDIIGKDGVEKNYDEYLKGVSGGKKFEVDAFGRPVRVKETVEPIQGKNMTLTIDLNLQQEVDRLLGPLEGAVVVLDPRTGEILAMSSHPSYNPNRIAEDINRSSHPFMNRALSSYPPGSIFKIVTLSAALEEGKAREDEMIHCSGVYKLGRRLAKCWLAWGHGSITPIEGLVWSCDVVFYELGRRLGPDLINKYAKLYGLSEKTGIDLPQEKRGFVPTSDWKKRRFGENWYDGDSINLGIGQGFTQVTPLQMAAAYGMIATGKRFKPYVVKEVTGSSEKKEYQAAPEFIENIPINFRNQLLLRSALRDVVFRGTGVAAYVPGIPASGKTGTAQNPGLPHAWFLCYAPSNDPEIVIAAFVAHGEHGDRISAYIARDILKWYKANRLKQKIEEVERPAQYILHGTQKSWYGRLTPASD
ncbi:MAG: penicillin-binding protein 2 [Candidatus Margulisiibacteriota bacterium]